MIVAIFFMSFLSLLSSRKCKNKLNIVNEIIVSVNRIIVAVLVAFRLDLLSPSISSSTHMMTIKTLTRTN